jgi:hypothetical protein
MQASLPPTFTTQYVDGELRFDLPVRPLGGARWLGLVPIVFGIVFVWGPAQWFADALQGLVHDDLDVAAIGSALFGLLFVVAGSIPIALGLWFIAGRCQIGWSPSGLRVTERLGPLRWTRRMPREPVKRLAVSAGTSTNKASAAAPKEFDGFAALMVEFVSGTKKLLALGYPKPMLLKVAEQLRSYIGGGEVEVVTPTAFDEPDEPPVEQPPGSAIVTEEHGDELRFLVPPAGLVRGSSGLFVFGILWCLFMAVITGAFLFAGSSGQDQPEWFVWLIMILFWAVGIGMLLAAINMGRRMAVIRVAGRHLVIETVSLFGSQRRSWAPSEVAAVRVDASGMEVNDKPVLELQIHPVSGKKVGLLAGRDVDELRWMAGRVRQRLGVERYAAADQ